MSRLSLVLTPGGAAELYRDGALEWNSADDESFRDEFSDELLDEDDLQDILEYLVSEDYLTEGEAGQVECEEEDLDGDDFEDDDEDEDEDEEAYEDDEEDYHA